MLAAVGRSTPWARCEAIGASHEAWIVEGVVAERIAQAAGSSTVYIASPRHQCCFATRLSPTRLDQVRRGADAGRVMPQKSTFLAPKIPTGVVIRPFAGEG